MKKILLINEYFSDNVGDQAIAKGLSEVFFSNGYDVDCEGFSRARGKAVDSASLGRGGRSSWVKWLSSRVVLKSFYWAFLNLKRVLGAAFRCQGGAVIGGGQLILSGSSFAIAMFIWVAALKIFGNKIFIVAVGVGEEFGWYEKALYKFSFSIVDKVYIRERSGCDRFERLFGVKAGFCPDAAFALLPPMRLRRDNLVCTFCVTSYDVHLRYASDFEADPLGRQHYWEEWSECVTTYVRQGYSVRFAWTTEADRIETLFFLESCFPDAAFPVLCAPLGLTELMDAFSESDVVVAGRMHALILAKVCGCELVPWVLSKKIERFAHEYLILEPALLKQEIESVVRSFSL